MTSEDIQKHVDAIRLIARSQAMLITDADATPQHTAMVLTEIAERCARISPCKVFNPDEEYTEEMKVLVEGAAGFCEATSEEQHSVWTRLVHNRAQPVSWEQKGGRGITIGYLDSRPVHVTLSHVDIAGHKVIFYEATSTVVDHDMVRDFIDMIAPDCARRADGRVNHSDAANMTNILPTGWSHSGTEDTTE